MGLLQEVHMPCADEHACSSYVLHVSHAHNTRRKWVFSSGWCLACRVALRVGADVSRRCCSECVRAYAVCICAEGEQML